VGYPGGWKTAAGQPALRMGHPRNGFKAVLGLAGPQRVRHGGPG